MDVVGANDSEYFKIVTVLSLTGLLTIDTDTLFLSRELNIIDYFLAITSAVHGSGRTLLAVCTGLCYIHCSSSFRDKAKDGEPKKVVFITYFRAPYPL